MQSYYKITTEDGYDAIEFNITTRKGSCHGIYLKKQDKIMVHLVSAQNGLKGLMDILVKKFKTRKIIFSPLITNNLQNKVRGKLKIIPANAKGNPYGEPIKILETEWTA